MTSIPFYDSKVDKHSRYNSNNRNKLLRLDVFLFICLAL